MNLHSVALLWMSVYKIIIWNFICIAKVSET